MENFNNDVNQQVLDENLQQAVPIANGLNKDTPKKEVFITQSSYIKEETQGDMTYEVSKTIIGFGSSGQFTDSEGKKNPANMSSVLRKINDIDILLKTLNADKIPVVIQSTTEPAERFVLKFSNLKYMDSRTGQYSYIRKANISYGDDIKGADGKIETYAPKISLTRGKDGFVVDPDNVNNFNVDVKNLLIKSSEKVDEYGNALQFNLGITDDRKIADKYPLLNNLVDLMKENNLQACKTVIHFEKGIGANIKSVIPIKKNVTQQQASQELNKQINSAMKI